MTTARFDVMKSYIVPFPDAYRPKLRLSQLAHGVCSQAPSPAAHSTSHPYAPAHAHSNKRIYHPMAHPPIELCSTLPLPQSQGFAYVEFETEDGMRAAIAKSGTTINGQQLHMSKSDPPRNRGGSSGHTAFVKGLGRGCDGSSSSSGGSGCSALGEQELRQLFADAPGGVGDVRIPKDDAGHCKVIWALVWLCKLE